MNQGFIPIGQFEAVSNGGVDWTQAFAQAFAEAAKRGGGTVYMYRPAHIIRVPLNF